MKNFLTLLPFFFCLLLPTRSYAFRTSIGFWRGIQAVDYGSSTFGTGTFNGTLWDSTNNSLRLSQTGTPTNHSELSADWTPEWASLTSYWNMNNSWADTMGTNSGIAQGSLSFTSSAKLGAAAGVFDGSTAYMTTTNTVNNPTVFTLSAWFKTNSTQGGRIIGFGSSQTGLSGPYDRHVYMDNSGIVYFGVYPGSVVTIQSPTPYNDGNWHHVVATIGSGGMGLYIDGILMGTNSNTGSQSYTGYWRVGYDNLTGWNNSINTFYFSGSIDEVAIWSTALTAAEVSVLYSRQSAKYAGTFTSRVVDGLASAMSWSGFSWTSTLPFFKEFPDNATSTPISESSLSYNAESASLMNGIAGLWHLDEAAGTTGTNSVLDKSGNSNNGTPSNVTFGVPGRLGTAAGFNSSSISLASNITGSATNVTIALWIYEHQSSGYQTLFMNKGNQSYNANNGYYIELGAHGIGTPDMLGSGGTFLASDTVLPLNQWTHLTFVFSGSTGYIYINGKLDTSGPIDPLAANSTNTSFIGNFAGVASYFSGGMDELSIWSRALGDGTNNGSTNEILELYRRGANRIKYQIRTCADSTCSANPTWLGKDGTNQTYFSELNNNVIPNDVGDASSSDSVKIISPAIAFANFGSLNLPSNRYIQYRAILESDDPNNGCSYSGSPTWCSPELVSVKLGR